MLKYLVFVVALFSSNCSAISVGSCKDVPVKPDFDVSRYVGKWYQIEKVNAPFEPNLKCVTATYTVINSTTIFVDNAGFKLDSNLQSGIQGYAYISDVTKPNHLKLKFPNIPEGTYQVLETDYDTYTLIYSCTQLIPYIAKQELTWILSRTSVLPEETRSALRSILKKNGIKTGDDLLFTEQMNC